MEVSKMHSQAGVSQKFFYMVGCAKFLIIFPKFLSFFQDFSNFIIEKISAMKILVVVMGGCSPLPP